MWPAETGGPTITRVVDLCVIDQVRELVAGAGVVCHLGNLPSIGRAGKAKGFTNNTSANYNVFLAATEAGVGRIVYASSVQVYGCFGGMSVKDSGICSPKDLPLDEDHPMQPADAYPLSKARGEWMADAFCRTLPDLTVWSLRFTGIRIPDAPPPHSPSLYVLGVSEILSSLVTFIYVDDAARATGLACETTRPGHTPVNIVNRASAKKWTPDHIERAYGRVPEFRRELNGRQALILNERAERLLGFTPAYG